LELWDYPVSLLNAPHSHTVINI